MRTPAPALLLSLLLLGPCTRATAHTWVVTSPDLRQTFSYGEERSRAWIARGSELGVVMEFTNDPYVDRSNPRQFDDFEFDFPSVRLGRDGKTFFYHPAGRKPVAVAVRRGGLFGGGARLLPTTQLVVEKRHGLLRLTLLVSRSPTPLADN